MRKASIITEITCTAAPEYFLDNSPTWVIKECIENGPIPCEGRGPAEWCRDCRFCSDYETHIEED